MSWDSFRDRLTTSGSVAKATIVGITGGIWTTSLGLNVTDAEIKELVAGLKNPSSFQEKGVIVGGQKYVLIRHEGNDVQAKHGQAGVSVSQAKKCLVIGLYEDGMTPSSCRTQVETMRDYLVSAGS